MYIIFYDDGFNKNIMGYVEERDEAIKICFHKNKQIAEKENLDYCSKYYYRKISKIQYKGG